MFGHHALEAETGENHTRTCEKRAKTLLEDADRYVRTHSCELECDAFRHGIVSRMTAWVLFRTWKTIVRAKTCCDFEQRATKAL
jgi:hypothetical protein